MKHLKISLTTALLCLAFVPSIYAQQNMDETTITVWGEAAVYNGDIPQAKERALQEAFGAAITQVMGTFINAESYTRNFESIERNVFAKTKGYVKNYKILQSLNEADVQSMEVSVTVSRQDIKDDLTAIGILLDAVGNPVCHVSGAEEGMGAPRSVAYFKNELTQKGFHVVETENGNTDILIQLNGTIENRMEIEGAGMNGVIVILEANAFWKDGDRAVVSVRNRANGAGVGEGMALQNAYDTAAKGLLPEFLGQVTAKWQDEVNNGRPVALNVKTDSYSNLNAFKRRLAKIFGVKSIDVQDFVNGKASLLVRFAGKTSLLAEMIAATNFENIKAEILEIGREEIKVHIDSSLP